MDVFLSLGGKEESIANVILNTFPTVYCILLLPFRFLFD